jgi:hypothetical protein
LQKYELSDLAKKNREELKDGHKMYNKRNVINPEKVLGKDKDSEVKVGKKSQASEEQIQNQADPFKVSSLLVKKRK